MKEFMNHLLYGMKTKQILLLFVLAFLLSSCIPPYCVSQRCIAIENKTSDTLLIGYSSNAMRESRRPPLFQEGSPFISNGERTLLLL